MELKIFSVCLLSSFPALSSSLQSSTFPKTWVPVASAYELDPKRPNGVEILNSPLVVYKEDTDWVVCNGVCSHRLAPLSEGRITKDNHLQCAYHGWEFKSGTCVKIPQADENVTRAALANPKCNLRNYPVIVEKNVIWAWLWDEPPSSSASELQQPEFLLRGIANNLTTYSRDLPYSYESLLENLVDPSHVPFAHHGLQGSREDALPINLILTTPVSDAGFEFHFRDRTMKMRRQGVGKFRAPYIIQYNAQYENPKQDDDDDSQFNKVFNLTAICIPTRPGWSRIVLFGAPEKGKQSQRSFNCCLFD